MDRAVITDNLQEWARSINGYCDAFGWSAPKVLKWQAGMLSRDLIDRTPVAAVAKIRRDVSSKFKVLGMNNPHQFHEASDKKSGHKDIRWYAWDMTGLFGVSRDMDLTSDTDAAVYKAYFENRNQTKTGRVILGQRGRQTVYAWRKITTTKDQLKRLADRLAGHAGRLAAGWSVSWSFCDHPGRALPVKVQRHTGPNAKGYYIDALSLPGNPTITIANYAPGVTNLKKDSYFLNTAILRRTRMIRNHVTRLIKNPEEAARTVPDEVFSE